MTEEGTFIINGCERIIISQIIRSPGIYFRKEFGINVKLYILLRLFQIVVYGLKLYWIKMMKKIIFISN